LLADRAAGFLCATAAVAETPTTSPTIFFMRYRRTGLRFARPFALGHPSVITCLANDEGYDQVFSLQLAVLARKGDVLIAFSGSGNSPNIVKALKRPGRSA